MALRRPILPSRLTGAPVPDVMPTSTSTATTSAAPVAASTSTPAATPVATPTPAASAPVAVATPAPAAPAAPASSKVSSADLAAAAANAFDDFPVAAPRVLEDSFAPAAPKATAATVTVTPAAPAAPAPVVAPAAAPVVTASASVAPPAAKGASVNSQAPAPGSMAAQAAAAAASKAAASTPAPAAPVAAPAVAATPVATPAPVKATPAAPAAAPVAVHAAAPSEAPVAAPVATPAPAAVKAAAPVVAENAAAPATAPVPSQPTDPLRRKVRAKQPRDFNAIVAPVAPAAPAPVTGAQTNFAKGVPVDTKPISQVQDELIATGIIAAAPGDSLTSQLPTGLTEEVLATPVVPAPPAVAPAPKVAPVVAAPAAPVAAPAAAPAAAAAPAVPKPLPQAAPRPTPQPVTPPAPTRPTAPVPATTGQQPDSNRTASGTAPVAAVMPVNPAPSVANVAPAAPVAAAPAGTARAEAASLPENPMPAPISPLAVVPPSPAASAPQARPAAQAPANALAKSANKNNNQAAATGSQWNVPEAAAEWELEPMHNPGWAAAEPAAAQTPSQLPPPGDVYRPQLGNAAGQWSASPMSPPQLPTARHSGPAGRAIPTQGTPWGMLLAGLAITGGVAWLVYQPTGGTSGMAQLAKLAAPAAAPEAAPTAPANQIGLLPPPELNAPAPSTDTNAKIDFTDVPPAEQNKPIMAAGTENMPKDVSIFAQVQQEIAAARARKEGGAPNENTAANLPPPADLTPEKLQEELSAYRRTLANAESASAAPKPSQFRQDPAAYMDGQNNARNSSALGAAGTEGTPPATDTAALLPPPELYLNNPKNLPVVAEPLAEAAARVRELSEFNVEPFTPARERVQIPAGLKPRLAATDFPGLEVLSFVPDKGIVAFADGREGVLLIGESINGWELTSVNPDRAEFKAGEKTYQLSAQ